MLLDLYGFFPQTELKLASDGLLAILRARPGLAGVDVMVGWPRGMLNRESVIIEGDTRDWTVTDRNIGAHARLLEERLAFTVRVIVLRTSDEFATLRDRVLALAGEVISAVRSDRSLAVTVQDARASGGQWSEFVSDEGQGRGLQALLRVEYTTALYA
jgi:hypothetical protein